MKYTITYAKISNIGNRTVNEDAMGVYDSEMVKGFILCDGLGGHGMGDMASMVVKDVFLNQFESMKSAREFGKIFQMAQDILIAEQVKLHAEKKMKTTAAALLIEKNKAYIGHSGDSRIYIFDDKGSIKRTLDHSIVQMLVVTKEIKESEIRNHPDRSVLLKVMGVPWEQPMYELQKPVPLKKCKAFLLCTDGFWEQIDEEDMCKTLEATESVSEWLALMNNIVQKNGKKANMDNNSAIAVLVEKGKV